MDCHLHITVSGGACKHYQFALHRTADDTLLGSMTFTRAELEREISEFADAKERIVAQIVGIVLGNKGKTPGQLKTILEAAVFRV